MAAIAAPAPPPVTPTPHEPSSPLGRYETTACRHPAYAARYQRNKQRLGRQRGAKVAQIDIARKLCEAIWHMLTRSQPFAPAGAVLP